MPDVLDRVVVQIVADVDAAQAKIDNYAKLTAQNFAKVDVATKKAGASAATGADAITVAAQKVVGSSRMMGASLTNVSSLLLTSNSPFSLINAGGASAAAGMGVAEAGASALSGVLTGGLAIAVAAAGSAVGLLVEQLISQGSAEDALVESIKQDAEQTERTTAAKEAFTRSVEGQEIATRELNKAMLKEIDTSQDVAIKAYQEARAHLAVELATRKELAAKLALRQDALHAAKERAAAPGANTDARALAIGPAQSALDSIQDQITENATAIGEAELRVGLTFTRLVSDQAARAADPIQHINDIYDQRRAILERSTATNKAFQKSLEGLTAAERNAAIARERNRVSPQFAKIEEDRRAALDTERERQAAARRKPPKEDYGSGREISEAQARAIVSSIGGRVTSGTRSIETQRRLYADKLAGRHNGPVAVPGTSAHERGKAIDVAFGPGITIASIKEAFAKEGVKLRKIFAETGQGVFHVDFGTGRGPGRPKKDTAAADAKRAADEKLRNDTQFESARKQLNDELLRALGSQTEDAATLAQLAIDQVNLESRAKLARIDNDEKLGKLTKLQADELRALAGAVQHAQAANIAAAMAERLAKEKLDLAHADLDNQEAVLDAQLDLADTSKQRHVIEQKLLDLKYEELRLQEQANIDAAVRNKDATEEKIARDRLALLPTLQDLDQQKLERKYETPGKRYLRDLNSQAGELKNSVEDVAVNGLQSLNDQLADAIVNSKSLGETFHNVAKQIIADLLRIAIQQAVLKPLAKALFGGDEGEVDTKGGGGFGGLLGSLLGKVLGSGGGGNGGILSVLSGAGKAGLPGFATGGSLLLGGHSGVDQNLLSLNGQPLARVSAGETLNVSPRARASTGGGSGGTVQHLYVDARGAVMNDEFATLILRQAATMDGNAARQTLAAAGRQAPMQVAKAQRYGTV